jgi:hypothetical protein
MDALATVAVVTTPLASAEEHRQLAHLLQACLEKARASIALGHTPLLIKLPDPPASDGTDEDAGSPRRPLLLDLDSIQRADACIALVNR